MKHEMSIYEIKKRALKIKQRRDGTYALLLFHDHLELWKQSDNEMFQYIDNISREKLHKEVYEW